MKQILIFLFAFTSLFAEAQNLNAIRDKRMPGYVVVDPTKGELVHPLTPFSMVSINTSGFPSEVYLDAPLAQRTIPIPSQIYSLKTGSPGTISSTQYFKLSFHQNGNVREQSPPHDTLYPNVVGLFTIRATTKNTRTDIVWDTVYYKDILIKVYPTNASVFNYAGNDTTIWEPVRDSFMVASVWTKPGTIRTARLNGNMCKGGSTFKWSKVSGPSATIVNDALQETTVNFSALGTYVFRLTMTTSGGAVSTDDVTIKYLNKKMQGAAPACRVGEPKVFELLPTSGPTLQNNAAKEGFGQWYASWLYDDVAGYIQDTYGEPLLGGDHIVLNGERTGGIMIDSIQKILLNSFGGRKECYVKVRTKTTTPLQMRGSISSLSVGSTISGGINRDLTGSVVYVDFDFTYHRPTTPWGLVLEDSARANRRPDIGSGVNAYFDFASNFIFRGAKFVGGGGVKVKMEGSARTPRQLRAFAYDTIVLKDLWQSRTDNEAFYLGSTDGPGYKSVEDYTPTAKGTHLTVENCVTDSSMWDGMQLQGFQDHITVQNNLFWKTSAEEAYGQDYGMNAGLGKNGIIRNNIFKHNRGSGFTSGGYNPDQEKSQYLQVYGNVLDSVGLSKNGNWTSGGIVVGSGHGYPEFVPYGKANVHHNVVQMYGPRDAGPDGISFVYTAPDAELIKRPFGDTSLVNDNIFVIENSDNLLHLSKAGGTGRRGLGYAQKGLVNGVMLDPTPIKGNIGRFKKPSTFHWTIIRIVDHGPTGYKIFGTLNGVGKEWTSIATMNADLLAAAQAADNERPKITSVGPFEIALPTNSVPVNPTVTDPEGDVITYSWSKLTPALASSISAPTSKGTSFTGLAEGEHIFRLTASDALGASFSDVKVIVRPEGYTPNLTPSVEAGEQANITISSVVLEAEASDPEDGTLDVKWTKVSGPSGEIIENSGNTRTSVSNLRTGTYVFRCTVTDPGLLSAFDDVTVVVTLPAIPGSTINVNLHGGITYENAEWNNWNLETSTTSPTLKFANGNPTNIVATLSAHILADNGINYGGNMAPPEVLRFTSNSTVTRNLNFTGLTPNKKYDIQLYAARLDRPGNVTIYTANGISRRVPTNNNRDSTATFLALQPTATGTLNIAISDSGTYNYINAFTIVERAGALGAPVANAGTDLLRGLAITSVTLTGAGTDEDGTISSYAWTKVSGTGGVITTPAAATTTITGLTPGEYTFRLTVTDNDGLTAQDDVKIKITALREPRDKLRLQRVRKTF